MKRILIISALSLFSSFAVAQSPTTRLPTTPYLPIELADKAAHAALEACKAKGYNVSVAVVSRDGSTKAMLKADLSGPQTESSAVGKGFTAAAMGGSTADLSAFITNNPVNAGMRDMDKRLVFQAGGLPIRINGTLVAGIGVGGAPNGTLDGECAQAGINAIVPQ